MQSGRHQSLPVQWFATEYGRKKFYRATVQRLPLPQMSRRAEEQIRVVQGKIFFMICLITGGARSGKSSYAQQQVQALTQQPVYVATAKVWDAEFEERVNRHKKDRDSSWLNIEEPLHISSLDLAGRTAVIDCVTLWLTNIFSLYKQDVDACLQFVRSETDRLAELEGHFFIVTNELGMGLHAETEVGRKFTDLQGWANQYIAQKASKVVFMVSGIPMVIKQ
jgi:adenosylcobinamide kinase/adenosylcobinamide-phosphate guanylyltransferase